MFCPQDMINAYLARDTKRWEKKRKEWKIYETITTAKNKTTNKTTTQNQIEKYGKEIDSPQHNIYIPWREVLSLC